MIDELRARIDDADRRLVALLNERAAIAQEIGRMKHEAGDVDAYRPGREAEVLRRVLADNPGPLADADLARIIREAMAACLALESPLRVAFLGPPGTYTEQAMHRFFGHAVEGIPCASVEGAMRDVEAGDADCVVLPVENSTGGSVGDTLDRLARSPLAVCGEIALPIHHHLLGTCALEDVVRVHAHPQSFAQCRAWLGAHLPQARLVATASNTEALDAARSPGDAIIAGRHVAEAEGLEVLASRIEDEPDNATRFLVVGRRPAERTGDDRTSIAVAAKDRPGALMELLAPFSEAGVNMTRIESRPGRSAAWSYRFFIDMDGHQDDAAVARVLERLAEVAAELRVLGSYPKAVL